MTPPRYIVDSMPGLAAALVARIAATLEPGAARWSLAIAGGSVAERLLPLVAAAPLPWEACHVFLADERAVAADEPASNWRVCRAAVAGTAMDRAIWHRLAGDAPDLEASAVAYAGALAATLGAALVFDVALLGLGEDGHVASAFPGRAVPAAAVFVVRDAPKPPPTRLSISPDVLAHARLVCLAAFGAGKAPAVAAAFDPSAETPAARLLRGAAHPLVLLDVAAASLIVKA